MNICFNQNRCHLFLDAFTDADVLIHVLDSSGTADSEGNAVGFIEGKDCDNDEHPPFDNVGGNGAGSHPLNDLAWVQNELIQWVYLNLESKWDNIMRRERNKVRRNFLLRSFPPYCNALCTFIENFFVNS